ncbi:TPA: response regulator transcription factor [Pseudomonas aeruginosa]|nr:response regulator transcription factor [Pseudomonas aeruginosa]MBT9570187.1 response regulator transcription factor [Pseudomonas umsongensis]CAD0263937.1 Transcriptional regulator [Pseudomonas veronii]MBG4113894.1 response regulator transcription factor [Pseudomonas aeruginosa]MBI6936976.1 response regulator transcription factor [Pseudomonas aeruginosa]
MHASARIDDDDPLCQRSLQGNGCIHAVRSALQWLEGGSCVIRVLVAEDHTIVREGIKQLIGLADDLSVAGEASNGEQLIETLWQTPCDVVLLDISMPGVSGLEAIPRIRTLNNPPAILVLSMHDEAQMAARALKIGAAGYATKDSDPALLLTAIRKVASGGRYIDPELVDRMVFEVGLTDARTAHTLLSEREFSVFERLVRGVGVNEIALQLAVSSKTVSTHKARLMQKLGLQSVADLVRYAVEQKLL